MITRRRAERFLSWLLGLYFLASLLALLFALGKLVCSCFRGRRRPDGPAPEGLVPDFAFREADPFIYSQVWLQKQGLAVTWQNPDIHLESPSAPGVAVDSHALLPDTTYTVFARIWNGSADGPAADVRVQLSYLDFGIGGTSVPIGLDKVDVPVKGASGSPAVARVLWRTPPAPGHYCLQAQIVWPYDANQGNNLGQHNTDVKPLNSPKARFQVPVRNTLERRAAVTLMVDGYVLPGLRPCPPQQLSREERERQARAEHAPRANDVPAGWEVSIDGVMAGQPLQLDAGETRTLVVTVTAPSGFVGRQAVNVQGLEGGHLIGGVTLIAEGVA